MVVGIFFTILSKGTDYWNGHGCQDDPVELLLPVDNLPFFLTNSRVSSELTTPLNRIGFLPVKIDK